MRQEAIVEEHRYGTNGKQSIVQLVRDDPHATHAYYRVLFIDRVSFDWREETSEEIVKLRKVCPDVLPLVKLLISGIVADTLASRSDLNGHARTDGELTEGGWPPGSGYGTAYKGSRYRSDGEIDSTRGSDGFGEGDSPTGFFFKFYRIGFWTMLFLALVMAGCWYWNIRYLRAYIAARMGADERKLPTGPPLQSLG